MDQTSNYGLLINQNTKLQRKQFIEMTKLLGIKVKYRYPLRNQNYTNSGELFSSYSTPIDVGCILNDHPDIKTTKKLGWNSELVDCAMVISLPYELDNLHSRMLCTYFFIYRIDHDSSHPESNLVDTR